VASLHSKPVNEHTVLFCFAPFHADLVLPGVEMHELQLAELAS
jgi:hypothetical protein